MNYPSQTQVTAGDVAARRAIKEYSEWDSSMIPDSAIQAVVIQVLIAALNVGAPLHNPVTPTPPKGP